MRVVNFRFKFFVFVSFLLISFSIHAAKKTYGDVDVEKVVRVYDGDTVFVDIKDYPDIIGKRIGIRIAGIDTPEMRDKNVTIKKLAKVIRDYVRGRLEVAKEIVLQDMKRGKYFRIVAQVIVDGVDLGQELIDLKLAKPYGGGRKDKWTIDDVEKISAHLKSQK